VSCGPDSLLIQVPLWSIPERSPYVALVKPTPYGVTHGLTWIAQAKHYQRTQVSTGDVRELVGSKELLVAKVFSTVDERYKELRLRKYAPTAVALITTEEIPTTVRKAG
jgi:hypothetical protein